MTKNISTNPRRLSALVGIVREYLAYQLRELGWGVPDAEVFGCLRRHFDLRATAPGARCR